MTGEVVPLRPELLSITGAVSNPPTRTIDPRRYERRAPKIAAAAILLALSLGAWGLIITALSAVVAIILRCADGWAIVANLFLWLVAISLGAGVAWAGVTITEAALLRWAM
jgi:apolipoprotein N-acyltransferase